MRNPTPQRRQIPLLCNFLLLLSLLCTPSLHGEAPRALPEGTRPVDARLEPLKDYDGYFPFTVPDSRESWEARADEVRRRVQVSQGLWPFPKRTPLNAVVHGRREMDGYTLEKAYFEALPGFFVTGNLYRPAGPIEGKRPGILCPHGHWSNGRFHDAGEAGVQREIANGGEQFENGGRSPLQARCVQLARMGCVVFHYDMLGYADSRQLSYELVHRFAKQRPEMNSRENWGLFSPQAESRLQGVMGLQTWSSIRALDFLENLPDVDPARLACTGASGGGTQTFLLGALEPRLAALFPAVMVSTAMQGGCTCENACLLRVETGNIEFAALAAPKPQGLTAAKDWTVEMETKGFPELKRLYQLVGAGDQVELFPYLQFGHNYNAVSRSAMYHFFNKHLKLGQGEPIEERDYERLTSEELTVWDEAHPAPTATGDDFERKLLRDWNRANEEQLSSLDAVSWRGVAGPAVEVLLGRKLPAPGQVEFEQTRERVEGEFHTSLGLLRNRAVGEENPTLLLSAKGAKIRGVLLRLTPGGKADLLTVDGAPHAADEPLLRGGVLLAGIDLLYQGEFLEAGEPLERTRRVKNPREAGAYTFGFNHSLYAQRVHDVLNALAALRDSYPGTPLLLEAGGDLLGSIAAGARVSAGDALAGAAIDTGGFRFAAVDDLHDPRFLPGGARYGDLPGMLALGDSRLLLSGESDSDARAAIQRRHREPSRLEILAESPSQAARNTWFLKVLAQTPAK